MIKSLYEETELVVDYSCEPVNGLHVALERVTEYYEYLRATTGHVSQDMFRLFNRIKNLSAIMHGPNIHPDEKRRAYVEAGLIAQKIGEVSQQVSIKLVGLVECDGSVPIKETAACSPEAKL